MPFLRITDLNLHHKRVLIREDFNVPMATGCITSEVRIQAAIPTIQYALDQQAAVILLSHLGRPQEGYLTPALSLAPIAISLQHWLQRPVRFISNWLAGFEIAPGEVVLCENVRMQPGEKANDPTLAKKIAALGDIFVMDAFATAHRAEASTVGAAQFAQQACAGMLLDTELSKLTQALDRPTRPLLVIVGGSKVSSKLLLLESLLAKADQLILGGGIANTFLAAQQWPIGQSLCETAFIPEAERLLTLAQQRSVHILLPSDVVVTKRFSVQAKGVVKALKYVETSEMILDIGPTSIQYYNRAIKAAGSIIWNGPLGVFEWANFEQGTQQLALAIANSSAFSIAGGGDTLAAIEKYDVADKLSYLSTGGAAFLAFIEGKTLPAVKALQARVHH